MRSSAPGRELVRLGRRGGRFALLVAAGSGRRGEAQDSRRAAPPASASPARPRRARSRPGHARSWHQPSNLAGAAVAILALTGCGGGSTAPQHHVHLTAFERHGKALFIPTCGACHELADAGTSGTAGPALTSPWAASRVREVIADGPSMMPEGLLTGVNADAVAAYVAAATR